MKPVHKHYFRHVDSQYLSLADDILQFGEEREDRTGTGTVSFFSPPEIRLDMEDGFPLLTTKKLHIPSIVHELLWFIKGDTNIKYLQDNGIKIWDADYNRVEKAGTHSDGDLGPIYGYQWRKWEGDLIQREDGWVVKEQFDQLVQLVKDLKENPQSRRHIVSAWNVAQLKKMALPPCHIFFQCYVHNDGKLDLKMYQRSADVFLGMPFNIASYSLLLHMLAHVTGLKPGTFIYTVGDAHLYLNHMEQIHTQLERTPKKLPTLKLNPDVKDLFDFKYEDIEIIGYESHPTIKGRVSVGE